MQDSEKRTVPRTIAILAVLLAFIVLLSAMSVIFYLDAKDREERLAVIENSIVFEFVSGVAQIQAGVWIALNDSYSSDIRFNYTNIAEDGFVQVYWSTMHLMEMFSESSREYETFDIVNDVSSETENLVMEQIHHKLLENMTMGTPLDLNPAVLSAVSRIYLDYYDVYVSAAVVDPDDMRFKVSMMDLDRMYAAAQEIQNELSAL